MNCFFIILKLFLIYETRKTNVWTIFVKKKKYQKHALNINVKKANFCHDHIMSKQIYLLDYHKMHKYNYICIILRLLKKNYFNKAGINDVALI